MGIWPYPPPYYKGEYCNKECFVNQSELELFEDLAKDENRKKMAEDPVLKKAIQFAINKNLFPEDVEDEEELGERLYDLVDDYLKPSSSIRIIDLKYFASYNKKAGFKFAIDGLHNLPKKGIFITTYCINPPGALYLDEETSVELKDRKWEIQVNSAFDWESPLYTPHYIEGFVHFKGRNWDKSMHMIVDVRKVTIPKSKKKPAKIEPYAWTIVPLFTYDGFTNSGIYQFPLMRGAVQDKVIKAVSTAVNPWERFLDHLKILDEDTEKPFLKYLKPANVIVRLIDGQREGHFQQPFDWRRMSTKYIPQNQLYAYSYNEAVEENLENARKLKTLIPSSKNQLEYNKEITRVCLRRFGLEHYLKRNYL